MKTSLTLSLAGTLLAGGMIGTFIEGASEPVRQGVLLGFGVWLAILGFLGLPAHMRD
jgi:hypothetical protein